MANLNREFVQWIPTLLSYSGGAIPSRRQPGADTVDLTITGGSTIATRADATLTGAGLTFQTTGANASSRALQMTVTATATTNSHFSVAYPISIDANNSVLVYFEWLLGRVGITNRVGGVSQADIIFDAPITSKTAEVLICTHAATGSFTVVVNGVSRTIETAINMATTQAFIGRGNTTSTTFSGIRWSARNATVDADFGFTDATIADADIDTITGGDHAWYGHNGTALVEIEPVLSTGTWTIDEASTLYGVVVANTTRGPLVASELASMLAQFPTLTGPPTPAQRRHRWQKQMAHRNLKSTLRAY